MAGDGSDAALGSAAVRQHHGIGRRKIAFNLRVADIVQEQVHPVLARQGVDDFLIGGKRAVGLPCHYQLVILRQLPEGFQ